MSCRPKSKKPQKRGEKPQPKRQLDSVKLPSNGGGKLDNLASGLMRLLRQRRKSGGVVALQAYAQRSVAA